MSIKLVASAVRRNSDGKLWTGLRHGHCIPQAFKETGEPVQRPKYEQGFVDEEGKFYDRKEAFIIAKENGQMLDPNDPWAPPTLLSEDLWYNYPKDE